MHNCKSKKSQIKRKNNDDEFASANDEVKFEYKKCKNMKLISK